MTTLGEILSQLQDRMQVYEILTESGNLALIAKLDQKATEVGEDPCDIAIDAVEAFTGKADAAAWTKLVGCVQNSSSPAGACLGEMIAWSMKH